MNAQQYALSCPPDYYPSSSAASSSVSLNNPYLPHDDGHAQNFNTDGFSTGSTFTYPHQEYRYLLDRGEVAFTLCTPSLVDNGLDATGLGFAGNPSSSSAFEPQPEEISAYQQPAAWGWMGPPAHDHGIVAPSPMYPAGSAEGPFFGGKTVDVTAQHANQQEPIQAAHLHAAQGVPQLPTPAAMADLLSPSGRSAREPSQTGYGMSLVPPSSAPQRGALPLGFSGSSSSDSAPTTRPTRTVEPLSVATQQQGVPVIPDGITREKKHACTMCHKRFDRPSTLRKHLLVHTGEKAFVCDTCGRRFGVASNLNRHVKRCILKPVNSPSPSNKSPHDPADPAALLSAVSSPTSTMSSNSGKMHAAKRPRAPMSSSTSGSPSSSASGDVFTHPYPQSHPHPHAHPNAHAHTHALSSAASSPASSSRARPQGQKRRRRAPSPSQWVPTTLQNFNLHSEDFYSICAPLLPVVYDPPREERNSFGENISPTPYHPCGWNGVLPGPGSPHSGLGGKDVRNYSFGGGRGEYMLGRIQLVC